MEFGSVRRDVHSCSVRHGFSCCQFLQLEFLKLSLRKLAALANGGAVVALI